MAKNQTKLLKKRTEKFYFYANQAFLKKNKGGKLLANF
jgi:hypothetical protein